MPAARVRSISARSLNRALAGIGAMAAVIVVVELALLLQTFEPGAAAVLTLPLGFAIYVAAGLIAWQRRPSNPMGAVIVWTGTAVLLGGIGSTGVPALQAVTAIFGTVALAAVIHLVLAFPTGRLESRAALWTVATTYAVSLVLQVPEYLFDPEGSFPPFAVADLPLVVDLSNVAQSVLGAAATISAVVILTGRLVRAERIHRRMLVPLLAYSIFAVLFTPVRSLLRAIIPIDPLFSQMLQFIVIAGVPIAFVFGLLRGGFPRTGGLEELGTWLGQATVTDQRLAGALASALGDPSLELYFWSDEHEEFRDADGREPPSRADARRGWSDITLDGGTVGVIGYDAELITDASLVHAAGGVVAIAVERERLSAALRAAKKVALDSRDLLTGAAGREHRPLVLSHLIADVDEYLADLDHDAAAVQSLTPRQREVLALVAEGRSNASIAAKLYLREKSVVQHVSRIYDVLGLPPDAEAHRRVQAAVFYLALR